MTFDLPWYPRASFVLLVHIKVALITCPNARDELKMNTDDSVTNLEISNIQELCSLDIIFICSLSK